MHSTESSCRLVRWRPETFSFRGPVPSFFFVFSLFKVVVFVFVFSSLENMQAGTVKGLKPVWPYSLTFSLPRGRCMSLAELFLLNLQMRRRVTPCLSCCCCCCCCLCCCWSFLYSAILRSRAQTHCSLVACGCTQRSKT